MANSLHTMYKIQDSILKGGASPSNMAVVILEDSPNLHGFEARECLQPGETCDNLLLFTRQGWTSKRLMQAAQADRHVGDVMARRCFVVFWRGPCLILWKLRGGPLKSHQDR